MSTSITSVKEQIELVINSMRTKNLEATMALFTDTIVLLGTGKDELWVDRDIIEYNWKLTYEVEQLKILSYDLVNLKIMGHTAYTAIAMDMELVIDGITYDYPQARITMVFVKKMDKWLIDQWHASMPQIGTGEIEGWPNMKDIQNDIENIIERMGIPTNLGDKQKQIREYLIKAKELSETI